MIYLIESFMRSGDDHPLRCLKIGYAKDVEDRLKTYKTHNPSVKLLKTREGEYDLENYLHKYFKRYELPEYQEWFIYSNKIIDDFEFVDIQEETITIDEYLEQIRKEILKIIIPKIYESLYIKIPKLLDDLERDFRVNFYNEGIYSEFPKELCEERIKVILKFLERKEVEYFSSTDFSDIRMDFPQIMGRQRLKENKFKDECIFIYKLSDESITMEEYNKISLNKIERSKKDLENFYTAKHQKELLEDFRTRVKVYKYSGDYTGIQESTGLPVINKLVMISEKRAFELRSNVYKSDIQVYNEFANISTELSTNMIEERNNEILIQRSLYNSNGLFETKMKSVCEFLLNPKWFGHIHVSDLGWLPLYVRNYIIQLGPKRILELGCREVDIRRELINQSLGDKLKEEIINLFKVGEKYSSKEIKEFLKNIYNKLNITKTPKATDLEEYFDVKEAKILDPITKKRDRGYEILSLK